MSAPTLTTLTGTRVYFAVPDHYTIGKEFSTWAEAVAAARATQKPLDWGGHTRAFVDVREADHDGDRMIRRYEIEATV